MTDIRDTLAALAAAGHSRTSAAQALGWTWHTMRAVAADYPEIAWRQVGDNLQPAGNRLSSEQIARAVELRNEGLTWKEVAAQVGGKPDGLLRAVRKRTGTLPGRHPVAWRHTWRGVRVLSESPNVPEGWPAAITEPLYLWGGK